MKNTEYDIAQKLIEIKAIRLSPEKPFTWASGWKSPIYCDNRKILSYPDVRNYVTDRFVDIIKEKYPDVEAIAGVATGAIAIGALAADRLSLPFVYIRSSAKAHGLENKIEGALNQSAKVVVIEDLISTGKSSLNAVKALNDYGAQVLGMVAIFTYGFPVAEDNFRNFNCSLITLSNYQQLLNLALETKYIEKKDLDKLKEWRQAPDKWMS